MQAVVPTLAAQDLLYLAYHEAGHAVAAAMLGCDVGEIFMGAAPDPTSWGFWDAPERDVETICAAGYATELSMGRPESESWLGAQQDLRLVQFLHQERTGTRLGYAQLTERFLQGVEGSSALLSHSKGRAAMDELSAALIKAYENEGGQLPVDQIRRFLEAIR